MVPLVYDVNVLVGAAAGGNSPFRSWPSPPPTSGNPYADCLGVVVDAAEFALWLSPHLLDNTARVLGEGLGWKPDLIEQYLSVLARVADHSGGGVADPPRHRRCDQRLVPGPTSTARSSRVSSRDLRPARARCCPAGAARATERTRRRPR